MSATTAASKRVQWLNGHREEDETPSTAVLESKEDDDEEDEDDPEEEKEGERESSRTVNDRLGGAVRGELLCISAFPTKVDASWIFQASPLVDRERISDTVCLLTVRNELSGFPLCKRTCSDAVHFYRVLGVWHLPWSFVAAESAFIDRWFSLYAWRRKLLIRRYGFYALHLHPDTWLETLARRDDADLLASLLSTRHPLDDASTTLVSVLIQWGAVHCLETLARKRGCTAAAAWADLIEPRHLLSAATALRKQYQKDERIQVDDARILGVMRLLQRHHCDLGPFVSGVFGILVLTARSASVQFMCPLLAASAQVVPPAAIDWVFYCLHAAERGHLTCLHVLLTDGMAATSATDDDHHDHHDHHDHDHRQVPNHRWIVNAAASAGRLEVVRYLHREHQCRWEAETCARAASSNRGSGVGCLVYLHENGCPWDAETCLRAAEADNLLEMQYAHSHGCPWNSEACLMVAGPKVRQWMLEGR